MAWKPAYSDPTDLRTYHRVSDDRDETELELAIETASRIIDHATNRQFGQVDTAEQRTYREIDWSRVYGRWMVEIDDIDDLTGFAVEVGGSAVTDFETWPDNAIAVGRPVERLLLRSITFGDNGRPGPVLATGLWGWTTVPLTIVQAVRLQAARLIRRRDAPFGIAGSPDQGSEMRLLALMDPDVAVAIKPYRRDWPMLG